MIPDPPAWDFSDIHYLESKNEVDTLSYNHQVRSRLVQGLHRLAQDSRGEDCLRVVDLGAGLLAMRPVVMEAGGVEEGGLCGL